jgi:hypothetical protein
VLVPPIGGYIYLRPELASLQLAVLSGDGSETGLDVRRRWHEAVDAHMDRVNLWAESEGLRLPSEFKRLDEHLDWAVRFQVGGEDALAVAIATGVDERTVRRAIAPILKRVGLDQRRERVGRKLRKKPVAAPLTSRAPTSGTASAVYSVVSVEVPVPAEGA